MTGRVTHPRPASLIRRFFGREGGAAAAEICLWVTLMALPVLNAIDLARYAFERMQVELAAQNAVNSVRLSCKDQVSPLSTNCTSFASAAVTGAQSTSLGGGVTLSTNFPTEGYYCVNGGALVLQPSSTLGVSGTAPTKAAPFDCAGAGGSLTSPGTYIRAQVTYTFTPLFAGLSATSLLATPIVRTAWLRIA